MVSLVPWHQKSWYAAVHVACTGCDTPDNCLQHYPLVASTTVTAGSDIRTVIAYIHVSLQSCPYKQPLSIPYKGQLQRDMGA